MYWKCTVFVRHVLFDLKWKMPAYSSEKLWSSGTTLALTLLFMAILARAASSQQSPSSPCTQEVIEYIMYTLLYMANGHAGQGSQQSPNPPYSSQSDTLFNPWCCYSHPPLSAIEMGVVDHGGGGHNVECMWNWLESMLKFYRTITKTTQFHFFQTNHCVRCPNMEWIAELLVSKLSRNITPIVKTSKFENYMASQKGIIGKKKNTHHRSNHPQN